MVIMLTQFSWEVVSLRSCDEEKKKKMMMKVRVLGMVFSDNYDCDGGVDGGGGGGGEMTMLMKRKRRKMMMRNNHGW